MPVISKNLGEIGNTPDFSSCEKVGKVANSFKKLLARLNKYLLFFKYKSKAICSLCTYSPYYFSFKFTYSEPESKPTIVQNIITEIPEIVSGNNLPYG